MDLIIDSNKRRPKGDPVHRHKGMELLLFLEGNGVLHTPGKDYPFSPGRAILVPPGMGHRTVSQGEFRSISVRGDISHLITVETPLLFWDNEQKDGAFLAQLLFRNRHENSLYVKDLASAYIRYWLEKLTMTGQTEAAVSEAYRNITENALDKDIDIHQILSASGYAEDYVRMLFRKRYGAPPVKFLAKLRMEHACFLMEVFKDTVPLTQIAEKCGYSDYVYFSKTFKNHLGISPQEYVRAKLGATDQDQDALQYWDIDSYPYGE